MKHKSIDMLPKQEHLDDERANLGLLRSSIADPDPASVRADTVKGSQQLPPRFEFSGACAGCGETPYLKLLTQLVGDRLLVANATGCSSIYGGNLPTTPWTVGRRRPRTGVVELAVRGQRGVRARHATRRSTPSATLALELFDMLEDDLGESCVRGVVEGAAADDPTAIARQRLRVEELRARLDHVDGTSRA